MATAEEVASFMLTEIDKGMYVYQETIVYQISSQFGSQFTYYNENGNLAISKEVLKAFRKISKDKVVWLRGDRAWRLRQASDRPGRQQDW